MSAREFTSVFAEELRRYLAFKQGMGCYGSSRIEYLHSFDSYCTEHEVTDFDRQAVESWVVFKKACQPGTAPSWMSFIRDFGRWMRTQNNPDVYVLTDSWKNSFARSQPYLLRREEISRFFQSAAELETTSPWKWQSVAFFALMHSCGLRTCETRRLQTQDVDLRKGEIDVLWSKGNRSRRLPITDEIIEILTECDRMSRKKFGQQRPGFFISSTPSPVTPTMAGVMFSRIWDHAGLPRAVGGQQPHPYSFRHHFAYANIERWMTEGTDVNAMLPYLAQYMGHASLDSTYYYIHTSPDFMEGYAALTHDSPDVFPEVGFQ